MADINTLPKCCKEINGHRNAFERDNHNALFAIPDQIDLTNTQILTHIRDCCGHGYFLDELLSNIQAGFNFDDSDSRFFCILACILDKDIHEEKLYDKVWKCMPLFKALVENGMDSIYNRELGIGKVLSDCGPLDPELIIDLIICANESPFFELLIERSYLTLHLDCEDIGKMVEMQIDIPDCVRKIQGNVPKIMDYEKDIIAIENIHRNSSIASLKPRICLFAREYFVDGYRVNKTDPNLSLMFAAQVLDNGILHTWDELDFASYIDLLLKDRKVFEDRETICHMFDDRMDLDDFRRLMYSLCNTDIPIYLEDWPVILHKASPSKSARK